MSTARTRISFGEFGANFMERVVTTARINDQITALLKKVPSGDLHGIKSIDGHDVRFDVILDPPHTVRTTVDDTLIGFNIALPMAVGVEVLAVPDHPRYALRLQATISLVVSTSSPLLIVIEPLPVSVDSIQVVVEAKDEGFFTWLAGVFGRNIEEQVKDGVKQTAATVISKSIATAGDSLTINVEDKINASL